MYLLRNDEVLFFNISTKNWIRKGGSIAKQKHIHLDISLMYCTATQWSIMNNFILKVCMICRVKPKKSYIADSCRLHRFDNFRIWFSILVHCVDMGSRLFSHALGIAGNLNSAELGYHCCCYKLKDIVVQTRGSLPKNLDVHLDS